MILVTGATGFVGSAVVISLLAEHPTMPVAIAVRKINKDKTQLFHGIPQYEVGNIEENTDWKDVLKDITCIVHCAARVHIMQDNASDPLAEYRKVNVLGTLNLAKAAATTGVKRFVYLSSIKVNGEFTELGKPFCADDIPNATDPYGISKLETEQGLREISQKTGMEVVCIRPPLVYGPGVKANFFSMMRWLDKGVILPFGAIHNKRSFVFLGNLVSLIVTCISHPNAANKTFLVSDDDDMSTTELLQRVAKALDKKANLIPLNQKILIIGLNIIGKRNLIQKLCGSLQVDIGLTKEMLNWMPPYSLDEGLKETAQFYMESIQ